MAVKLENLEQETKRENKLVAGWLLYVDDREAAYIRRRGDALTTPSNWPKLTGGSRGNNVSDPTAARAGGAYHAETEQWIAIVREVEQRLPEKMQVFLRLRREYRSCIGRRGWVATMQREYAKVMTQLTGKDVEVFWVDGRNTFGLWWDRIVEYAARLAAKKGLLD